MHINEIGKQVNIDPEKLGEYVRVIYAAMNDTFLLKGRILRFLSTHHIFLERNTGVFANNRLSSVLHKGKTYQELKDR